jgi:hypothetical protein
MIELPPNRRKGYQIKDRDGNHICDLACDIPYQSRGPLASQFTNWQNESNIPKNGDSIHPAIWWQVRMGIIPNYKLRLRELVAMLKEFRPND